jgi:hypothetical protein
MRPAPDRNPALTSQLGKRFFNLPDTRLGLSRQLP